MKAAVNGLEFEINKNVIDQNYYTTKVELKKE